ncbi:two component transcriptional regulator, LuxR family [Burkholderia sp. GAS332]|nr:two component transcriptional regulator, LuxR family [Burkholderia sp. GAS332]
MAEQIGVVIVDDHALFRRGVSQLLNSDPGVTVLAEASCGREGIDMIMRMTPDVALVDLHMRDIDGITLIRAARSAGSQTRFIMLTVSDSRHDLDAALEAGAAGYLLKDMEPEDLCRMVRAAVGGDRPVAEPLLSGRGPGESWSAEAGVLWETLTDREREILKLVGQGASNKMIANLLGIAESTVKVHVKHLLSKLKVRSRVEAAIWLQELRPN